MNPEELSAVPERPRIYHRCRDPRSPLIVELNLELVPRILADLQAAQDLGLEGGGVLIGSFPKSIGAPALRIDDFEPVLRRSGDGLPYILLAEQRHRFAAVRKRAATREVSAVGFYRSHLRTGPFELTLADRDLLSAEFKNTIHVALLIGNDQSADGAPKSSAGDRRHVATYFVSVNGIIQNRVDPLTVPFDAKELEKQTQTQAALQMDVPAMPGLPRAEVANGNGRPGSQKLVPPMAPLTATGVRRAAWLGLAAIVVLSLLFVGWGWERQGSRLTAGILTGSEQPLTVTVSKETSLANSRQALEIGWNHSSHAVLAAASAHLTIINANTHRTIHELDLQPSELALGSLRVELDEQPAEVSLVVNLSDGRQARVTAEPTTGAAIN